MSSALESFLLELELDAVGAAACWVLTPVVEHPVYSADSGQQPRPCCVATPAWHVAHRLQ